MKWLRARWSAARKAFDVQDAHIYGGLAVASVGGWLVSPRWALVGLGVALAALGLYAGRR